MQRKKVHHVYTVERVARDLGASEALIQELTLGLEPEDGVIWVYGANDDDGILAFTDEGIESNSSSKNIIASPHRKLDPAPLCSGALPPDTHVCDLHRTRTKDLASSSLGSGSLLAATCRVAEICFRHRPTGAGRNWSRC